MNVVQGSSRLPTNKFTVALSFAQAPPLSRPECGCLNRHNGSVVQLPCIAVDILVGKISVSYPFIIVLVYVLDYCPSMHMKIAQNIAHCCFLNGPALSLSDPYSSLLTLCEVYSPVPV